MPATYSTDRTALRNAVGVRTPIELQADGWTLATGPQDLKLGMIAWTFSRGAVRQGIVVAVGRKNATLRYVTAGGLARYGENVPVTERVAPATEFWTR